MGSIVVSGGFDTITSRQIRFLEEASQIGPLHVYLWSDEVVKALTGSAPQFPWVERQYFLEAVRYIHKVHSIDHLESPDEFPQIEGVRTQPMGRPRTGGFPAQTRLL